MNCPLAKCSLNQPDACHCSQCDPMRTPVLNEIRKKSGVTRRTLQESLDDYDSRIKAMQAGRTSIQRAMDELPVEVCPKELARLYARSQLLGEIEDVVGPSVQHGKLPGPALLVWLRRSNILRGQRL